MSNIKILKHLTYTGGIPEAFDTLKDCSAYTSHCEGTTTVIYNTPWAVNRKQNMALI